MLTLAANALRFILTGRLNFEISVRQTSQVALLKENSHRIPSFPP